jgi:hypothetical protein
MNLPPQLEHNNQSTSDDQEVTTSSGICSTQRGDSGIISRRNLLRAGTITTGLLGFTLPPPSRQLDDLGSAVGTVSAQSTSWSQQNIFNEPTVDDSAFPEDAIEEFGLEVALSDDGNTAFVSAPGKTNINNEGPPGSVFVYTRDPDASWVWNRRNRFVLGTTNDGFGNSVSVSGSDPKTVVIGAPFDCIPDEDDTDCVNAGSVYIYTGSGDTWNQQDRLVGNNPESPDQFGSDVAVSNDGDTVVISALKDEAEPYGEESTGSVYVFVRDGETWSQQARLPGPEPESPPNAFGSAVAISDDGNTIVIGDTGADTTSTENIGKAYLYTRSGSAWSRTASLIPADINEEDGFGSPLAISGDGTTVIVGVPFDDGSSGDWAGSAYVFANTGGTWSQQTKLTPDDGDGDDRFGSSMSITDSGDTAIIGAPRDEDPNGEDAGSAYIFKQNSTGWSQQTKLYTSTSNTEDSEDEFFDNPNPEAGRLFGSSVSLSNSEETALIGAPTTSGFVENRAYEFGVEEDTNSEERLSVSVSPSSIGVGSETNITILVSDQTGSPVEGALVEIPDLLEEDTTDSEGTVDFTVAPSETSEYLVITSKEGYSDGEDTLSVVDEASNPSGTVNIKNVSIDKNIVEPNGSTHTLTFDVENLSADGGKDEFDIALPSNVEVSSVNIVSITGLKSTPDPIASNPIEFSVDPSVGDISSSPVEFEVELDLSVNE